MYFSVDVLPVGVPYRLRSLILQGVIPVGWGARVGEYL